MESRFIDFYVDYHLGDVRLVKPLIRRHVCTDLPIGNQTEHLFQRLSAQTFSGKVLCQPFSDEQLMLGSTNLQRITKWWFPSPTPSFFIQWNYFYHEEPFLVDLDKLLIPLIGDLYPVLHPPRPPFAMAISVATCFSKRYSAAPLLIVCICIYFGHICISFSASPQPSLLPRGGGYICLTHIRHLEV